MAMDAQVLSTGANARGAIVSGSDTNCIQQMSGEGQFNVYYDPDTELVNMVATLTDGSFAGWGWGGSMSNTEMVIFSADGSSSGVSFVYGVGKTTPESDSALSACYTTGYETNTDGTISVTATRPLDCTVKDYNGDTYVVQLDTDLSLIIAWNPKDPQLSFHQKNYSEFTQMLSSDGTCQIVAVNHNPQYYTHGAFMWGAWALIGLLQIYTNRYYRHMWKWSKLAHAILGFFAGALMITAGFIAIKTGGWTINSQSSLHAKAGFSTFILGLVLMLGGITANIIRLKVNLPWKTKKALFVGKVHKWFGRCIVFVSQFVIGSGAINFYTFDDEPTLGWALAGASAFLFFLFLIIGEVRYQMMLRKEVALERPAGSMTASEFDKALVNGRQLVILDDLVLDVSKFIEQHPGGRFVLQHNIGRDVSKFFHGGYSLEDNLGPRPARGYTHSTLARLVVNDLAIAVFEPKSQADTVQCRVVSEQCKDINSTTRTIVFESMNGQNVPSWRNYQKDLSFIGKHFLVRNLDGGNKVARHYTICNAMRPEVYNSYINALKQECEQGHKPLDKALLDSKSQNQMTVCIKNYRQPKGLSTKIHEAQASFEVKGPMGYGLRPKASGHHLVFAAGTGVLCFVDLVAELCKLNTSQTDLGSSINSDAKLDNSSDETRIDADTFQLHLYVSFPRRSDSVALELFEALDAYCKRAQKSNFHLYVRLSQEKVNPGRWDERFIQQEIKKFGFKNIQKVWVCGPPVMNETFDRVFSGQAPAGNGDQLLEGNDRLLQPDQYEIL